MTIDELTLRVSTLTKAVESTQSQLDIARKCIDSMALAVKLTGENMMEVARTVDAMDTRLKAVASDQRITDRIVAELRRERAFASPSMVDARAAHFGQAVQPLGPIMDNRTVCVPGEDDPACGA